MPSDASDEDEPRMRDLVGMHHHHRPDAARLHPVLRHRSRERDGIELSNHLRVNFVSETAGSSTASSGPRREGSQCEYCESDHDHANKHG